MISNDVVNAKDFGAIGDGVTDDTAALKLAVAEAASSQKILFIPSGLYVLSDTLDLNPNDVTTGSLNSKTVGCRVVGENQMATRILFKPATSTTPAFKIRGVSGNSTDQSVSELTIVPFDGTYERSGVGVQIDSGSFVRLSRLYIQKLNIGVNGVADSSGEFLEFITLQDCRFVQNSTGFVLDGSAISGCSAHGLQVTNTTFNIGLANNDKGIKFNDIYLYNSYIEASFFAPTAYKSYMIYAEDTSYNFNAAEITCENDAYIYVNNGSLGFSGTVSQTPNSLTFEGNGRFLADNVFFPENTTTDSKYSGFTLEPITNNFNQYVKASATYGIFAVRNANGGFAASVPSSGSFVVGTNSGQDPADFNPFVGIGDSQVLAYSGGIKIGAYTSGGTATDVVNINAQANTNTGSVYPVTDDGPTLGVASKRWKEVFAVTGTINTSDQREKQQVRTLTDAEIAVATSCKSLVKAYKWNNSVASKGEKARIHIGVMAQELEAAFTAQGLDASDYGMFCSDTWWTDAEGNVFEEDGEGLIEQTRLGVRYDQVLAFIISTL